MKEKLKFRCFKHGNSFLSNDYKEVIKNTKRGKIKFAVAHCPKCNTEAWRILGWIK